MWTMVSTAPSCCRKSENFATQNLLHSVHYLLATCSIFPLICYMLMLVLLESTTRFWQDVAQADPHGLAWLSRRRNAMLVTGAQGRSGFSELFHKSFVNDILNGYMMPMFIAHR